MTAGLGNREPATRLWLHFCLRSWEAFRVLVAGRPVHHLRGHGFPRSIRTERGQATVVLESEAQPDQS
jgi:hypothetical protein